MKITIDPNLPDLSVEEMEEAGARAKDITDDPEQARADLLKCNEVVFSPQVVKQLEEAGITPDDLVALLLKAVGASQ